MPPRIEPGQVEHGKNRQISTAALAATDLGYEYPNGLNLQPGHPMHDMIVSELSTRADDAFRAAKEHHPHMQEMDRIRSAFTRLDENERKRKTKDDRKPVSIVLPFSYAAGQTIHTNYMAQLAGLDELHRFGARNPEDRIAAILMERIIAAQSGYFKELKAHSIQAMDFLWYGFGTQGVEWQRVEGLRTVRQSGGVDPVTGEELPGLGGSVQEPYLEFEGNRVFNIDPYLYWPDANHSIVETEDMEGVTYGNRTSRMRIIAREKGDPDSWFNADYLTLDTAEGESYTTWRILSVDGQLGDSEGGVEGSERIERSATQARTRSRGNLVHEEYHIVELIPSEWKVDRPEGGADVLGESEVPELWMFVVAGDRILLHAQPLEEDHQRKGLVTAAPTSDGYSHSPVGHLEMTKGVQKAMDFLWNTKMAFTLKFLKGRFLADEERVNLHDIKSGAEVIRLRRLGYTSNSIDSVIKSLQITNPTTENLNDISFLNAFGERSTGATDPIQGVLQVRGERRSAEEARGARLGALSRIEHMLLIASQQSHQDLGYMMMRNTQQYLEETTYARLVGRSEDDLLAEFGQAFPGIRRGDSVPVKPWDVDAVMDVMPLELTRKAEENVESLIQLYQIAVGNPQLGGQLDMVRIFKQIARLAGWKNVNDFMLSLPPGSNVEVADNEEVLAQQDAGNLQAVEGAV